MAFAGDLQSISLSDIFQNLSQNERTGRLRVMGESDSFHILFRGGRLAGVEKAQGTDEYLLGVLKSRGNLTGDDFGRVVKKQKAPAGPVATAVKLRMLKDRDAEQLLEYYVTERVLDVFSVDRGSFEFLEGDEGFRDTLSEWEQFELSIDPGRLLFEAARRSDEWDNIKKVIISEDEIFAPCVNIRESVRDGIDGEDLKIFVNVDGLRTLREVVEASRESKFTVFRGVSRLLENKMIMPLQVNQTLRLAESLFEEENYLKCIDVARKGLSVERNNPSLRHILARALSRAGHEGKAAEELKLLALSHLDEGNPGKAIEIYREVVDLVPSDIDARQRIFDLTLEHHSEVEGVAEGKRFVAALREFGLNDRAQGVLRKFMDIAPDDLEIQHTFAEVNLALGDKTEAIKTYHRIGEKLRDSEELALASKIYAKIVKVNPHDEVAGRLLGELEEGVYQIKERKRRVVRRIVAASALVVVLVAWVVYDFVARAAYVRMNSRTAVAMADGDFDGALGRVEDFRQSYPFSTSQASARHYSWTLRVLASLSQARKEHATGRRTQAKQWYRDALGKAQAHLGESDPLTAVIQDELGKLGRPRK
jgi:tetratricopeptide (TPR) repeat protein